MRLGNSGLEGAFAIVEYNLFENANADPEVIEQVERQHDSRYNTIIASAGTISLRIDKGVVSGNFVLGNRSQLRRRAPVGQRSRGVRQFHPEVEDRSRGQSRRWHRRRHGAPCAGSRRANHVSARSSTRRRRARSTARNLPPTGRDRPTTPLHAGRQAALFPGPHGAHARGEHRVPDHGRDAPGSPRPRPQYPRRSDADHVESAPPASAEHPRGERRVRSSPSTWTSWPRAATPLDIGADQCSTACMTQRPLTKADVGPNCRATRSPTDTAPARRSPPGPMVSGLMNGTTKLPAALS